MAIENFGSYTEVDPNSKITVGTRRAAWTDLNRNEDAYVYKDKGAAFFDGDFIHYLTIRFSATEISAEGGIWALTNDLDDLRGLGTNSKDALYLHFVNPSSPDELRINGQELDGGTAYGGASYYVVSLDTTYYLKMVRDESVGTYGTLYSYVYSDDARTTLLATLSVALHTSKKDFRYVHAVQTWNAGTAHKSSGYSENLELLAVLTEDLQVTTEPTADITNTTATGNGTIVNLGLSSVTAHGHAWNTSIDPVTGDNNVDNGAGSLGVFTSSITGLIAGQQYYMRAYATNSEGTVYGANVTFIAGNIGSQLIDGNISIVQTRLHYVDKDGKERYLEGILV